MFGWVVLIASVNSTLKAALDSVEGEIKEYLEELGEEFMKKENATPEEKKETLDLLEPLNAVIQGFWEPVADISSGTKDWWKSVFGKTEKKGGKDSENWAKAKKGAFKDCFTHYKLIKNANGLLTW